MCTLSIAWFIAPGWLILRFQDISFIWNSYGIWALVIMLAVFVVYCSVLLIFKTKCYEYEKIYQALLPAGCIR